MSRELLSVLLLVVVASALFGCPRPDNTSLGEEQSGFAAAKQAPSVKAARKARLLIEEDFDQGKFSPGWNGSFIRQEDYPAGVKPFVQMPGHGWVLQQYIPAGSDETSSAQVGLEGDEAFGRVTSKPGVDEFYIQWEEFYPEDHVFAHGSQKMLRFVYWKEGEPGGASVNFWNQYANGNLQLTFNHPQDTEGRDIDVFKNTNRGVPTGRWVKFAVWCKLNTPGKRDGFGYAYVDGRQIAALQEISNRGNDTRGFNNMWIGGTHTNQGKTRKSSHRYIDNIRWYDTKPE